MENNEDDKNKKKDMRQLNLRFQKRITLARQGQEAVAKHDFVNGIKYFNMYLKVLADVKEVEAGQLSPKHFDPKTAASEIMLISHIYWELCKIYDKIPKLENEFHKSLSKFLEFTIGYRHQVINSEMMRKFIRKDRHVHKEVYLSYYKKLYSNAKKCYIATYCFGEDHKTTNELRVFRTWALQYTYGEELMAFYNQYSPLFVDYFQKHTLLDRFIGPYFIKPCIFMIAKFLNIFFR